MKLLDDTIRKLEAEDRVGIMAHLVAGYRSLEESRAVALGLAKNGADILEIQIPFSDPTADGPVITAACQESLLRGMKPKEALDIARDVISETGVPVLMMSYFNILYRWRGGLEAFLDDAASCGVSGMIVPDIPPEEKEEPYYDLCRKAGLHPTVLVSPNMSDKRLEELTPFASGIVYATARVGTTGAASDVQDKALLSFLKRVRGTIGLPVALGFGIRSRRQIDFLHGHARIAVIGTHFLRILAEKGKDAVFEDIRNLSRPV